MNATDLAPRPMAAAALVAAEDEVGGSRIHPLLHTGKWLVADLLSTLLFVGLFALTHSVFVATGVAIAGGIGQILYLKARKSEIDVMQWMSLALVAVFGGASLLTRDPRFIMIKPTLIYVLVGTVMLKRGWMTRYMPPSALTWSWDIVVKFGYVWAGLMYLTGMLNLVLELTGDAKTWAWFVGVFPLASKLILFAVQYLATRFFVRARMREGTVAATA